MNEQRIDFRNQILQSYGHLLHKGLHGFLQRLSPSRVDIKEDTFQHMDNMANHIVLYFAETGISLVASGLLYKVTEKITHNAMCNLSNSRTFSFVTNFGNTVYTSGAVIPRRLEKKRNWRQSVMKIHDIALNIAFTSVFIAPLGTKLAVGITALGFVSGVCLPHREMAATCALQYAFAHAD